MSVKIHLMLNSKMLIDGDGDAIVATSLLDVSNLVVLKVTHSFTLLQWFWLYFRRSLPIKTYWFLGILCDTVECEFGSSWTRFPELNWTWRSYWSATFGFVPVLQHKCKVFYLILALFKLNICFCLVLTNTSLYYPHVNLLAGFVNQILVLYFLSN